MPLNTDIYLQLDMIVDQAIFFIAFLGLFYLVDEYYQWKDRRKKDPIIIDTDP